MVAPGDPVPTELTDELVEETGINADPGRFGGGWEVG